MGNKIKFFNIILILIIPLLIFSCENKPNLPNINATADKETLLVGEKTRISVSGIDLNSLHFQTRNDVLSVDDHGLVTGEKAGSGIIEITYKDKTIASIAIKVVENALDLATFDVNLEKNTISILEKTRIIAKTSLDDKLFEYKPMNSLVDVDKEGNITPIKEGNERIQVSHSSGYSKILELTIKPAQQGDISVKDKTIKASPEGGIYSFSIRKENKSTSYNIEGEYDFLSISIEEGELEDIVTIHVNKNNSRLDKYATLYIKNHRNTTKARIEISQEMNLDSKITYYWLGGVNDNNSIKYTKALPGVNDLYLEVRENENTKFYNAKKMSMTGPDKDMCGTYTASNLAHWFLAQNQDNIEKYKAQNKIEDPTFAQNAYDYKADAANMSSIAQYYKEAGYMKAYPHIAIEWLLAGKELEGLPNGPGWFAPILKDKRERYITIDPTASKDDLERIIFNAYAKNAVLAMNYFYTSVAQHAVNIWGFGVDEENNVVELFQADSNIQNNALTNIGIYYKKNKNEPYLYNLSAKKGYGKTDWKVMDLATLYNGRDLFEEYFNHHQ